MLCPNGLHHQINCACLLPTGSPATPPLLQAVIALPKSTALSDMINTTAATLRQQLAVLNSDYSRTGLSFRLASMNWYDNPSWAADCGAASESIVAATAVSPATQLNIYVCQLYGPTPRGASTVFGFALADGVFVDYRTLPGGTFGAYSGGRTATHEMGHWAGLAHVFDEGGACGGPGDGVADTPAQRTPTSGCPAFKDSCPDWPGQDSVHNFMGELRGGWCVRLTCKRRAGQRVPRPA